jgi:hypothetical protein
MKSVFVFFVIIAIGVSALGYQRGWFSVHATADPDRFEQDKEEFRKKSETKLQVLDEKIDKLSEQAKKAEGDVKVKLDKDIVELRAKKKAVSARLDEIKSATASDWVELKKRTGAAFAELEEGFEKAADRLKK